jgi:septal ring factor EnvC (AmiA/AmiB activator)
VSQGQRFVNYVPPRNRNEEPAVDSDEADQASLEKRRAQNRAAQRAFRVRKLQKVKTLEESLAAMISQHDELRNSYQRQEDVLSGLRSRIAALQKELAELRAALRREDGFGGTISPEDLESWNWQG